MIFYLIYVAGISIFEIYPALCKDSAFNAILMGALSGIFTYITCDLTNITTLKGWPLDIVFIDILWGVFLTFKEIIYRYCTEAIIKNVIISKTELQKILGKSGE